MTTEEQAAAAMSDAMERAGSFTYQEVRAALLALALAARAVDPTVAYVELEDSDQGDWLMVRAYLDADKEELDTDDWFLDDEGYAGHLYDYMGDTIKEFAPLVSGDEKHGRHSPIYHLDVDKAIAEITVES